MCMSYVKFTTNRNFYVYPIAHTLHMPEDKKRINIWIPTTLYKKLAHAEYPNITEAVVNILESFFNNQDKKEDTTEQTKSSQARIEDLKAQVDLLAQQLHTKDDQIEKLNENMHKQAVHIQSLIQENSRLNIKLLPENMGKGKQWWKFW
jgi:hypothetical protein